MKSLESVVIIINLPQFADSRRAQSCQLLAKVHVCA